MQGNLHLIYRFTHILISALVLSGCGGGGGGSAPPGEKTPSVPDNVQAIAGDSQVSLSWNNVNGATGYNIYWGEANNITKSNGKKFPM